MHNDGKPYCVENVFYVVMEVISVKTSDET